MEMVKHLKKQLQDLDLDLDQDLQRIILLLNSSINGGKLKQPPYFVLLLPNGFNSNFKTLDKWVIV